MTGEIGRRDRLLRGEGVGGRQDTDEFVLGDGGEPEMVRERVEQLLKKS